MGRPPPPGAFGGTPTPPLAGLVERGIAVVIDLVLIAIASLVILIPFLFLFFWWSFPFGLLGVGGLGFLTSPILLLSFVLWVLYFSFFESRSGQTVGKRLLHIRVVDRGSGRPPELPKALLRNLLRVVDWLPTLFIVGFIVALLTPQKQRLGDLLAETIVVRA